MPAGAKPPPLPHEVRQPDTIDPVQLNVQWLDAAVRTLQRLGYTHTGGEEWRPPLGKPPAYITEPDPSPTQMVALPLTWSEPSARFPELFELRAGPFRVGEVSWGEHNRPQTWRAMLLTNPAGITLTLHDTKDEAMSALMTAALAALTPKS